MTYLIIYLASLTFTMAPLPLKFSLDSSLGRAETGVFVHLDDLCTTVRISRNSDPDLQNMYDRIDLVFQTICEMNQHFQPLENKTANFDQTPMHSFKPDFYFNVGNITFDRSLISAFPTYGGYTMGRIRVHVMYVVKQTVLKLGPFESGKNVTNGTVMVVIEIIDWYWCKPCFNMTVRSKQNVTEKKVWGKGIVLNLKFNGVLGTDKLPSNFTKISKLEFSYGVVTFPNLVSVISSFILLFIN
ncbi:hypothetical protein RF11_13950 [Thelohanellus kitauei]|uniref:Uncharacterized protein n=1 Tax=Thelohanellus kitauei TaxID=669202 RepID=A0A0C2IVV0_THEKT|nr:hypothetical protein RF11_13950 [Thelohanellus kitauei]